MEGAEGGTGRRRDLEMEFKKRVIVCGVGFGQFYLRALEKMTQEYELAGIFAKGSDWAKECAQTYQVPLYTKLDEITKEVTDVVCVVIKSTVVGGAGTDLAKAFLEKGIHVVQEHPVHADDLSECLKLAKQNKVNYSVNTFYPDLLNVQRFLSLAEKIRKKAPIRMIRAECSIHVLFPLVDILGRAAGGIRPWHFELLKPAGKDNPFCIVSGTIHNIPVCLQVQNQLEPGNPENNLFLLHSIALTTNSGNLMMTGTNGNVIWEPCMNKAVDEAGVFRLDKADVFLDLPVFEIAGAAIGETYREMFQETWPDSIRKSLRRFHQELEAGKRISPDMQYLISATAAWKELAQVIGQPMLIEPYEKKAIRIEEL